MTNGGKSVNNAFVSLQQCDNQSNLPAPAARHPTFAEAFRFWLKLGFISFGGPTGQIAIMHTELVDKKKWISESRFLHALNYCMILPGPEAQQLAIYIGWLLHRTSGGIVAGATVPPQSPWWRGVIAAVVGIAPPTRPARFGDNAPTTCSRSAD